MDNLNLVTMLLMAGGCLAAVFMLGNDQELWPKIGIKVTFLMGVIIWGVVPLYHAMVPSEPWDSTTTMTSTDVVTEEGAEEADNTRKASSSGNPEPSYSDPLWPTTNTELLAIPEADRWYSARNRINSYGTIAGPVASVAFLDNRVMVNIGADYPDPSRAQVVVWAERVPEFEDMLDEIDRGNAWISVSGQISEYDGVAEIDVNDSDTEWLWWTGVR
jgi:hypothetical protein